MKLGFNVAQFENKLHDEHTQQTGKSTIIMFEGDSQ